MHVSICIATWNDVRYLPELFASIRAQTHKDVTVRVFDNGSNDGETVPYILREEPHWLAGRSTKHLGNAGAKNHLVRMALERFRGDPSQHAVLLAESSTVWHPEMIATLLRVLETNSLVDAVQPKVLRAFSERGDIDADAVQSDILDGTGGMFLSRFRMRDRGAGEMDRGQYDENTDAVLLMNGVTLLRSTALVDVLLDGKIFDESFGDAAEDVDFALRFVRCGHPTQYVPNARAHRYRGFATQLRDARWFQKFMRQSAPARVLAPSAFRTAWALRWKQWTLRRVFFDRDILSLGEVRSAFRPRA
jgi:GT2 family glycosyltransferase